MKKYNIKDLVSTIDFEIKGPVSGMYIKDYAEGTYNYIIDWDVYLPKKSLNLQRDFVWTLHQKQELIKSMIKETPIAPFYIIQYKDDSMGIGLEKEVILKIIDGKQRFSTMIDFYLNKFPLHTKEGLETVNVFYKDLDDETSRKIRLFHPTFMVYYEYPDKKLSEEQLVKWFEHINFAGTPQEQEHLNKLKR